MNGIVVGLLTILLILIGIGFGPLAVFFEWDPLFVVIRAHCPTLLQNNYAKLFAFIVRYVLQQWGTLEASRIYWTILVAVMTLSNSYLQIVLILVRKSLGSKLILLYHQLHCINQVIQSVGALIAGILMSIGIILMVICNALVVSGWNILPAGFYFLTVGLSLVVSFCISQTIAVVIKCNELCIAMLGNWQRTILRIPCFKTYWIKVIRAQRLVAVYYGLTKFEKETKRNYYSAILNYTIDVLLLL